jgi:transposase
MDEIIIDKGCGLDVHKETVVACVMGSGIKKEIRTFSTKTNDLLSLKTWLSSMGITHVAMESTGSYWKPVFNVLEDSFTLILANARHIKNVPGRKTDVKDSEWICRLLRSGLLAGSFIPPQVIRELRDLTRYRRKLMQSLSAEKNRIQKVLEDANIKISSVLSDTFGVSGSQMITAIMEGKLCEEEMANLAKGKLTCKKEEIREALVGYFQDHHRFMIRASLEHIKHLEKLISDLDWETKKKLEQYQKEYDLLQTIPGVKEQGAASIIAEIGVDMNIFPSEGHLSTWAGMSPGNNESAGKKKSGKTTQGNKNLRAALTQCAWAASKTKNTYLSAKYHSLVGRRGKKRALIAIGHKILVIAYHIIKNGLPYKELGKDYLLHRREDKIVKNHIKRLRDLGYEVELKKAA